MEGCQSSPQTLGSMVDSLEAFLELSRPLPPETTITDFRELVGDDQIKRHVKEGLAISKLFREIYGSPYSRTRVQGTRKSITSLTHFPQLSQNKELIQGWSQKASTFWSIHTKINLTAPPDSTTGDQIRALFSRAITLADHRGQANITQRFSDTLAYNVYQDQTGHTQLTQAQVRHFLVSLGIDLDTQLPKDMELLLKHMELLQRGRRWFTFCKALNNPVTYGALLVPDLPNSMYVS